MKIYEDPWFVEIFKMIREFFVKWTGSCRNRILEKALIKICSNCLESYSRWNFSISSLDLELVKKTRRLAAFVRRLRHIA